MESTKNIDKKHSILLSELSSEIIDYTKHQRLLADIIIEHYNLNHKEITTSKKGTNEWVKFINAINSKFFTNNKRIYLIHYSVDLKNKPILVYK